VNNIASWFRFQASDVSLGVQIPIYPRRAIVIALIIILAALTALWSRGSTQNFLLCDMECGETVLAVGAADQFKAQGVQFGLLENFGSAENPKLYTHNVNIGDFLFIALQAAGIDSFSMKMIAPLLVFGGGLLYIYFTVLIFSKSKSAALITLTAFSTTYWGFGAFALNPLRSWHSLAFFMVCYHVGRWTTVRRRSVADLIGLCIGAALAFGCGYDFWVICGAAAVSILLMQASGYAEWRLMVVRLASLGAAFAFPFILRQLNIIYVLGAADWWQDLVFSLAIKIPGASRIITIPSMAEIDAFYTASHIMRAPATPSSDWLPIFNAGIHMVQSVTIPRWGIVTVLIYCFLLLVGVIDRVGLLPRRIAPPREVAWLAGRLLLPMTIGIAIGLAALSPFSLHVYLKHEFPLIAFPLLLARGIALYWLASLTFAYWRQSVSYVAAVAFVAMVIDAGMVHWNALTMGHYLNSDFRRFVIERPNSKFLISNYWGNYGRVNQLLGLPDNPHTYAYHANVRETLATLNTGGPDAPDFWIYQPDDQVVEFDSDHPTCRWQDWILHEVSDVQFGKPRLSGAWMTPTTAGPGTTISFGGSVKHLKSSDTISLAVSPPLSPVPSLTYNCIYGTLSAWATVTEPTSVVSNMKLFVRRQDGREFDLHDFRIQTNLVPYVVQPAGPFHQAQLSISDAIMIAGHLKVVERSDKGIGYVIFEVPK